MTLALAPNVPVENLPILYVNGLQTSNDATTPNTVLDIAVGQCRDSNNVFDMVYDSNNINYISGIKGFQLNFGVNGLNGLDTGTIADSTQYYIYAIASSQGFQPSGFLASASATAPVMPFSYDLIRLIDYRVTNSSGNLILAYVVGNGTAREQIYDTPIEVITAGTSATALAVSLAAAVPPVQNTVVVLNASYSPATAGDSVTFTPGDSSSTVGPSVISSVASVRNSGSVEVVARLVTGAANIKYKNSASSGSTNAWVQSFRYSL